MVHDYQGNSNRDKTSQKPDLRVVNPVVSGTIVPPKKSIGRKFRETFFEDDLKTVGRYLISYVMIPAAKNLLWETFTQGGKRWIFGNSMQGGRQVGPGGSIFNYNGISNQSPMNRPNPLSIISPPKPLGAPQQQGFTQNGYLVSRREEADLVLEHLNDLIDSDYKVASVADLHQLLTLPHNFVEEGWGWYSLQGANVYQTPNGWVISLPPAQPLR